MQALNIRPKTIKLLEENIDRILFDIKCNNIFLDLSLKANETKAKINKWDPFKLKSFCTAKEIVQKNGLNERKYLQIIWSIMF